MVGRDVTMHPEPVENQYKYVTIQIGWDVKLIASTFGGGSSYEGNLLYPQKFRWYFIFLLPPYNAYYNSVH